MQKKLFIFCLSILISSFIIAQPQKGKWVVGNTFGTIGDYNSIPGHSNFFGFGYVKEKGNDKGLLSLNISPSVGKMLTKSLYLGGELFLSYLNSEGYYKRTIYGVGANFRYYMSSKKITPYVTVGIGYGKTNSVDNFLVPSTNYKGKINSFKLGLGTAFFVSPNISIDGQLLYKYMDINDSNIFRKEINDGIGFTIGFSLFF